jgi:hypothetical protein
MSVKTITRVAAGSALLGLAVLNPSVAQAKNPPILANVDVTLAACPGLGLLTNGTAHVGTAGYTMSITRAAANNVYDFRARYSYVPTGSTTRVFSKARDINVTTNATGAASYTGNIAVKGSGVQIYRLDVVDVTSPLDNIAFTSDGAAACD